MIQPETNFEYIFQISNFLIGILIFATIVGEVGTMISNMKAAKTEFQTKMDGLKQYMELRSVERTLQDTVDSRLLHNLRVIIT